MEGATSQMKRGRAQRLPNAKNVQIRSTLQDSTPSPSTRINASESRIGEIDPVGPHGPLPCNKHAQCCPANMAGHTRSKRPARNTLRIAVLNFS
jgi:hypothetical protein